MEAKNNDACVKGQVHLKFWPLESLIPVQSAWKDKMQNMTAEIHACTVQTTIKNWQFGTNIEKNIAVTARLKWCCSWQARGRPAITNLCATSLRSHQLSGKHSQQSSSGSPGWPEDQAPGWLQCHFPFMAVCAICQKMHRHLRWSYFRSFQLMNKAFHGATIHVPVGLVVRSVRWKINLGKGKFECSLCLEL